MVLPTLALSLRVPVPQMAVLYLPKCSKGKIPTERKLINVSNRLGPVTVAETSLFCLVLLK